MWPLGVTVDLVYLFTGLSYTVGSTPSVGVPWTPERDLHVSLSSGSWLGRRAAVGLMWKVEEGRWRETQTGRQRDSQGLVKLQEALSRVIQVKV